MSGGSTAQDAGKFVVALNTGTQGDAQGGLRIFKARPRDNLVTSYGAEFTTALEQLRIGEWRGLPSKDGVRIVRLDAVKSGEASNYEAVRERVYQDWKDATMQDLRTAAVRDLGKKYIVKLAGPTT
jgi:hypothetical protein